MESIIGIALIVWLLTWIFGDSPAESALEEIKSSCVDIRLTDVVPIVRPKSIQEQNNLKGQIYRLWSMSHGMQWVTAAMIIENNNIKLYDANNTHAAQVKSFQDDLDKFESGALGDDALEARKIFAIEQIEEKCRGYEDAAKFLKQVNSFPLHGDEYKNKRLLCTSLESEGCIGVDEAMRTDFPIKNKINGSESFAELKEKTGVEKISQSIKLGNVYGYYTLPVDGYGNGFTGFLLANKKIVNPRYSFADCGSGVVFRSGKWKSGCRFSFRLADMQADGELRDVGVRIEYSIGVGERKIGSNDSSYAEDLIKGGGLTLQAIQ